MQQPFFVDPGGGEVLQCVRDAAALRRRPCERVRAPTPILVHVFGDVGEMRKIGKGAHDVQRVGDCQRIQQCFQLGAQRRRLVRIRAAESNRGLTDRFDARESRVAGLRAHDIAQQSSEEPRVFFERSILVGCSVHGR